MITGRELLLIMKDLRESESLPDWVCQDIKKYNERHGRRFNPDLESELAKYKPKSTVVLYRGLGLSIFDAPDLIKKFKFEPKVGSSGKYKSTRKLESWTSSASEAENFAGLHDIAGRKEKSLGLVMKASIKPDDIMAALTNLPADVKKRCLRFDQSEYIIKPGTYSFTVHKLIGDWTAVSHGNSLALDLKSVGKQLLRAMPAATKLTKNWNKSTGFAIDFGEWGDKKWSPSLQVLIDDSDFKVMVEMFGREFSDLKVKRGPFSASELNEYIKSRLFKDAHEIYLKAKERVKR